MTARHVARLLGLLVVLGAAALGAGPAAAACTCGPAPSDETEAERQDRYDLVFTGRALERLDGAGDVTWRFDVEGVAKGEVTDPQDVVSAGDADDCGYRFALGERFHVYAGRATDGRVHVSTCSPTRLAYEQRPLTPGGEAPATSIPRPVVPGQAGGAPPTTSLAGVPTTAPLRTVPPTTADGVASGEPLGGLDRTGMVLLASILAGVVAASVTVAWQHDPPQVSWRSPVEEWDDLTDERG